MIACAGSWLRRVSFVPKVDALEIIALLCDIIVGVDVIDNPDICTWALFCRKYETFGSRVQLCNSVCRNWCNVPNLFHWLVCICIWEIILIGTRFQSVFSNVHVWLVGNGILVDVMWTFGWFSLLGGWCFSCFQNGLHSSMFAMFVLVGLVIARVVGLESVVM